MHDVSQMELTKTYADTPASRKLKTLLFTTKKKNKWQLYIFFLMHQNCFDPEYFLFFWGT